MGNRFQLLEVLLNEFEGNFTSVDRPLYSLTVHIACLLFHVGIFYI